MRSYKSPAELKTRTIRVNIGDWQRLTDLSFKLKKTIAETLDWLLTRQAKLERMVATQAILPEYKATEHALGVRLQATRATNGKAVAFRIKQKGVRYD